PVSQGSAQPNHWDIPNCPRPIGRGYQNRQTASHQGFDGQPKGFLRRFGRCGVNSFIIARRAPLMLQIIILALALLLDPAVAAGANMSDCRQLSDLSAARLRWVAVRKSSVGPAQNVEICRSYGSNFFEVVTARQAASFCGDEINRRPI